MSFLKHLPLFAASLAAALALFALLLRLAEDSLTFHPSRETEAVPGDFGLSAEEMLIPSGGQGDSLHGWYFPPADSAAPVLLVFHGNAGNIAHRLEWAAPFVRDGMGVLLFDYRGYGRSGGQPSEKGFQEDALTVWTWLTAEKGLDPGRIVPFGRSLGGAPAVHLASCRPVRALVLEGAFTRGADMAKMIFGFLPVGWLMKYRWEVERPLAGLDIPVLLIHGTEDTVVPFALGERLARAARQGRLWRVHGGGHLDAHYVLGRAYYERLELFVRENASGAAD
ncbi:alpha/beta hydrolase [bacterium]|nr:alpha/beta hydrolase [bacterium]